MERRVVARHFLFASIIRVVPCLAFFACRNIFSPFSAQARAATTAGGGQKEHITQLEEEIADVFALCKLHHAHL